MTKNVIGLDIGGTKITGVVFDGKKIVHTLTIYTPKNLADFKHSVTKLVEFLSAGKNIYGLGIGQPGVIDAKTGIASAIYNTRFLKGVNLKKFYQGLGIKNVITENDAHCFALAESFLGKGKNYKNFIGITLGTGIGGGIILNRRLYQGSHKAAGHAGHIMADLKHDSEHYYQIFRNKKNFRKLGETVGILFANIMNVLDIEAVILGGSVATIHGKQFLPHALEVAKKHVVNNKTLPKVLVTNLKHAGAIGAALLFKE